jgi:hypothetical protein
VRPKTATGSRLVGELAKDTIAELAKDTIAERARMRFEPMAIATDLATSVELLTAAIETVHTDQLEQADDERLIAWLDASFEILRQVRRRLRREVKVAGSL